MAQTTTAEAVIQSYGEEHPSAPLRRAWVLEPFQLALQAEALGSHVAQQWLRNDHQLLTRLAVLVATAVVARRCQLRVGNPQTSLGAMLVAAIPELASWTKGDVDVVPDVWRRVPKEVKAVLLTALAREAATTEHRRSTAA